MNVLGTNSNYSSYYDYSDPKRKRANNDNKNDIGKEVSKADTKKAEEASTTSYKTTADYTKYLLKKYSYFNKAATLSGVPTKVSVSDAFIKKCMNDPEKAKYLEENLNAIPNCISMAKAGCYGKLINVSYNIDENGNISSSMTGISGDGSGRPNLKKKVEKNVENKKLNKKRAEDMRKKMLERRGQEKKAMLSVNGDDINRASALADLYANKASQPETGSYFDSYKLK